MVTSYINGKYVDEPYIPAFDLGFLRGYGVIENLRTFKKNPVFLDRHLRRLEFSAAEAHIPLRNNCEEITTIVHNLIENNDFSDSVIRIIATKGLTKDGLTPIDQSSLFILTTPLPIYPPALYKDGIRAVTANESRQFPHIKTLNYFQALMLLEKAGKQGAKEVLYCKDGAILEGTICNFFAVKEKKLITPSEGILGGITREVILEAAQDLFEIEERQVQYAEISEMEEAFTTSSIKGIVPIVAIDDQKIGTGTPGKITEAIRELYQTQKITSHLSYVKAPQFVDRK